MQCSGRLMEIARDRICHVRGEAAATKEVRRLVAGPAAKFEIYYHANSYIDLAGVNILAVDQICVGGKMLPITQPPLVQDLGDETLVDYAASGHFRLLFAGIPCHSQAVERNVRST
ncbi:hypothetical protein Ciccas_014508, partial [Cichlidogyrus casuarinus]